MLDNELREIVGLPEGQEGHPLPDGSPFVSERPSVCRGTSAMSTNLRDLRRRSRRGSKELLPCGASQGFAGRSRETSDRASQPSLHGARVTRGCRDWARAGTKRRVERWTNAPGSNAFLQ